MSVFETHYKKSQQSTFFVDFVYKSNMMPFLGVITWPKGQMASSNLHQP